MSRAKVAPYLIAQDEAGQFRITIRSTRLNSQGYPLVTAALQAETFKSATAARAYAREHFGAQTGEFAVQ
jgi:hypothetical protein